MDMKQFFTSLVNDESGQDIIEYALLAAVIALGSVAAMSAIATHISTVFASIGTRLTANTT